jgi:hydroxyacylglutathione hydrolase
MIHVKKFTFNPFAENTYVLSNDSKDCIIVDPGCSNAYEQEQLISYIEKAGLKPVRLLNSHCHIDHVLGNDFIMAKYNLKLETHRNEIPVLARVHDYAAIFGVEIDEQKAPDLFLEHNDICNFGETYFRVLHAPGHSPGSICFYFEPEKIIICGDVLFKGSVGRYDLPSASGEDLYRSVTQVLMALPDDVVVFSGHGPETTIGDERRTNPFLKREFFFGA